MALIDAQRTYYEKASRNVLYFMSGGTATLLAWAFAVAGVWICRPGAFAKP